MFLRQIWQGRKTVFIWFFPVANKFSKFWTWWLIDWLRMNNNKTQTKDTWTHFPFFSDPVLHSFFDKTTDQYQRPFSFFYIFQYQILSLFNFTRVFPSFCHLPFWPFVEWAICVSYGFERLVLKNIWTALLSPRLLSFVLTHHFKKKHSKRRKN